MEFVELSRGEVEGLSFGCESFLQSWEMYERYQQEGKEAYFVGVKDGHGKILAAGLMQARKWKFGKKIFRVAGGWLLDYDTEKLTEVEGKYSWQEILEFMTNRAKEFCRKRGGIMVEIAPNIMSQPRDAHNNILEGKDHLAVKNELEQLGYKYLGEYEQVKWTFVLDIEGKSSEELFKAFRTDHRQRIRRAEREGVRVRELKEDELGILKEIAAEAGERHGFQDPDVEYYKSMKRAFGRKIKFVVAELPAEKLEKSADDIQESVRGDLGIEQKFIPLAAAMFVLDKNEIIYLYSGSVRSLQKYGGAHLIQWMMIQEAVKNGCKKYNFYGVYPVEGNGVYNFKLGFRGRVEELLGTFALPIGLLGKIYLMRVKYREYGELH